VQKPAEPVFQLRDDAGARGSHLRLYHGDDLGEDCWEVARRRKITLGIDEAGRGPVIGPMVMAAVALDSDGARWLSRAGMRDSKDFGAGAKGKARRRELADAVREKALFFTVQVVDVVEIDRRVRKSELNILEREVAGRMISMAPVVDRIVADGRRLFGPMCSEHPRMEAWDGGESRHVSVAAASVLAKTRRDEIFECIQRRYAGEFGRIEGGGYVNAATKRFLRAYASAKGGLPPEARRSWPYQYLRDILGEHFDPYADTPSERVGQLGLFS
jgi:ribonuclease HII